MLTQQNIMASSNMAAIKTQMDKENTMKELKVMAKELEITASHFPTKNLLVDEITRVIIEQKNESAKAQVPRDLVEAIDTYLEQDRKFGEANICGIESAVIVTGKEEHQSHRVAWNKDMQKAHPEIFETVTSHRTGEEITVLKSNYGASYAIISSLEDDADAGFTLLESVSVDTSGLSSDLLARLQSKNTSTGLYSRADVEQFVASLNDEAVEGFEFGYFMTDGVDECAQWTLYDIVQCPEDEKVKPNGCFKIESGQRRTKKGEKMIRSYPDPKRINSVSMGMLTHTQKNFENKTSSWFANAFAFKHNVLARLGLMQFATNRNEVNAYIGAIVTANVSRPMIISDVVKMLQMALGGKVDETTVQQLKEIGWSNDHPYTLTLHKTSFKRSSKTGGSKHDFIHLNPQNITDLTVKSLIAPLLEVAGFNGSSSTMDILAQENRTGSEPLALTNISYLMGAGRAAIEADALHDESELVKALARLEEAAIFRPYGVNEGYRLASANAQRAKPQLVKTHIRGKTGRNESHLRATVREFAGETTICLLATPYSEETLAERAEIFKDRKAKRSS